MSKREERLANLRESTARPGATPPPPAGTSGPTLPPKQVGVAKSRDSARIELARIVPDPDQPRKEFTEEKMAEIVGSMSLHGQLQPVRVIYDDGLDRYVLLMGERRYRAAIRLGLEALDAVIHSTPLSAAERIEIQLDENRVRDDLKPIELATKYRELIDVHGYTQSMVAARFKLSQSAVSQSLSLLGLPESVQAQVEDGTISTAAARQIAKVDSPEAQVELAREVVEGKLTEDQAAEIVKTKRPPAKPRGKGRGASSVPKPKVKTVLVWNDGPIKFRIECKKGIDPSSVQEAFRRKFESLATAS